MSCALCAGSSTVREGTEAIPVAGLGQRAAASVLRLYKSAISPMLPSACRFFPTCSQYANEAIARHGVTRGGLMAAKRLLRCQPFSAGGYDPVP